MKTFIKHKTSRKIKIMLTVFLAVNIILLWFIVNDFLTLSVPFYYIFFVFIWLVISLVFRKDKTIKWDEEIQKVVKNTEITIIILIVSIILIRKFVLPDIFEYYWL